MTLSSLSSLRIAITVFPGSNCDRDMMVAVEQLTNRRPALIWHKEASLDPVDLVIVPVAFHLAIICAVAHLLAGHR